MLSSHLLTAVIKLKQALARSSCSSHDRKHSSPQSLSQGTSHPQTSLEGLAWLHLHRGRCQALAGSQPFIFL